MQFLTSPLLETLPHLYHGFGTRSNESLSGIIFPQQVHGNRVVVLDAPVADTWHEPADALITMVPGLPIGVKTADCLPILMAERYGRGVAAVHAGWKGMALRILPKAIEHFRKHLGIEAGDITLAVGPGIGQCCLEVDAPVRDFFAGQGLLDLWESCIRAGRPDHWWLDLKIMAQKQAIDAGVRIDRVDILPYCTKCEEEYFYSYRREGLAAGRQANYIVFKDAEAKS